MCAAARVPCCAVLQAAWDVLGDSLWRVNFKSISFSLLGLPLVVDRPLTQSGNWRLVYTDEDFRVLFAAGGNKPENLYILARCDTTFDD
jgi:lipocalin